MLENLLPLQNRYQLVTKLGDRSSRQTWLAEDLVGRERVIVKLLAFGAQVEWQVLTLFEREAQILKQLDCTYIPKYRDYFTIDDRALWFGLVEDYIPGKSLDRALADGEVLTEERVKSIAIEVLQILDYLHSFEPQILHRDIKPSNLILDERDRIHLIDFGAVQDRTPIEGVTFTVAGTYGYTPMEQFSGRAVPASDLYALAATLIHLLTGISPANLPQQELRIQFREIVKLDRNFARWLDRMLSPSPEHRYQTAKEALDYLQNSELFLPVVATKPTYSPIEIERTDNSKLIIYIPIDGNKKSLSQLLLPLASVINLLLIIVLIGTILIIFGLYVPMIPIYGVLIVIGSLFAFVLFGLDNGSRAADREAFGKNRKYCVLRLDRSAFQIADNYRTKNSSIRELIGLTDAIDRIEIENSWRAEPPRHKTIALVTTTETYVLPATMTIAESEWLKFEIEAWLSNSY
jgi:serine/threonine protein kinase